MCIAQEHSKVALWDTCLWWALVSSADCFYPRLRSFAVAWTWVAWRNLPSHRPPMQGTTQDTRRCKMTRKAQQTQQTFLSVWAHVHRNNCIQKQHIRTLSIILLTWTWLGLSDYTCLSLALQQAAQSMVWLVERCSWTFSAATHWHGQMRRRPEKTTEISSRQAVSEARVWSLALGRERRHHVTRQWAEFGARKASYCCVLRSPNR